MKGKIKQNRLRRPPLSSIPSASLLHCCPLKSPLLHTSYSLIKLGLAFLRDYNVVSMFALCASSRGHQ
jgi:hypothetical protein